MVLKVNIRYGTMCPRRWARLTVELVDDAFEASHHLAPLQPLLTSDQQQIQQQEEEQGGGVHELDTRTVGREMCQVTVMIHCIG